MPSSRRPLLQLVLPVLVAIAATAIGLPSSSSTAGASISDALPPRPPVPPGASVRGIRDAVVAIGNDGRLFDTGERRSFSLYVLLGEDQVRALAGDAYAWLPAAAGSAQTFFAAAVGQMVWYTRLTCHGRPLRTLPLLLPMVMTGPQRACSQRHLPDRCMPGAGQCV